MAHSLLIPARLDPWRLGWGHHCEWSGSLSRCASPASVLLVVVSGFRVVENGAFWNAPMVLV
jgi:hypothetical protein